LSVVRRQTSIAVSPRTVWNAITTAEGLNRWLGGSARVDGREGGRVSVDRGAEGEASGLFHTFRPTAKIEIQWTGGPWKGTFTQFSVARDRDETVLNLLHTGSPLEDEALRASVDNEWKAAFTRLRDGLEVA
jgi:uncharacterized protein YndB with AHSA1/START domain